MRAKAELEASMTAVGQQQDTDLLTLSIENQQRAERALVPTCRLFVAGKQEEGRGTEALVQLHEKALAKGGVTGLLLLLPSSWAEVCGLGSPRHRP